MAISHHGRSERIKNPLSAVESALAMEREGAAFFETAASRVSRASAKSIFDSLAKMEAEHIMYLEAQRDCLLGQRHWTFEPCDHDSVGVQTKAIF